MSVKLIDNKAFYGYRARRSVAGVSKQQYFSLTKDSSKRNCERVTKAQAKRICAQAEKMDAEFKAEDDKWKEATKGDRCFRADGSVKCISVTYKKERNGDITPAFQIALSSPGKKMSITTSSIKAHGEEGAWNIAVDKLTEHKGISKRTKLYKKLLVSRPAIDMSRALN